MSTAAAPDGGPQLSPLSNNDASVLKKLAPYWYPYTTMAKERWLGREILEIVSTEFRDRSMEYYVRVLHPLFLFSLQITIHYQAVCS
jgi:hypothetical protein